MVYAATMTSEQRARPESGPKTAPSEVHTSAMWDELTPGAVGRLFLHGDPAAIAAALCEWTDGAPLTATELSEALQAVAVAMIP